MSVKKREHVVHVCVIDKQNKQKEQNRAPLIALETLSYPVWMRTKAEISWYNMFVSWEIKLANFIGFKGVQE